MENKYNKIKSEHKAIIFIELIQMLLIIAIIFMAGYFNNWWLLFLLALTSITNIENKILGIKDKPDF